MSTSHNANNKFATNRRASAEEGPGHGLKPFAPYLVRPARPLRRRVRVAKQFLHARLRRSLSRSSAVTLLAIETVSRYVSQRPACSSGHLKLHATHGQR